MTKKTKKSKNLNNRSLRKKVYRKKNQKGKGLGNFGTAKPAKRVGEDFITAVKMLGTKNQTEAGSKDVAPTEINIITKTDTTTNKEIKYFVLTFKDDKDAKMYYSNSDYKGSFYNPKRFILDVDTFKVLVEEFLNKLGESTAYKTSEFFKSNHSNQIQSHNQLMDIIRTVGIKLKK